MALGCLLLVFIFVREINIEKGRYYILARERLRCWPLSRCLAWTISSLYTTGEMMSALHPYGLQN
jgi:hypothetical protein